MNGCIFFIQLVCQDVFEFQCWRKFGDVLTHFLLLTRNDSRKAKQIAQLTNHISDRTPRPGLPVSLLLDKGNLLREQPAFLPRCATPPPHRRLHSFALGSDIVSCDL